MKKFIFPLLIIFCVSGCNKLPAGGSDDGPKVNPISPVNNVSLTYQSSSEKVTLSRDVQSEGATVSLKSNSSWIRNLKLAGKEVSFDVAMNSETNQGHRFDTIEVKIGSNRIGTICVTQARKPKSSERFQWCTNSAGYYSGGAPDGHSGKAITQAIYNLEKTTNGKDSYKNYPAFAYCIEMNHDPDKDMEWYLPSYDEMIEAEAIDFDYYGDKIYWSASSISTNTNALPYSFYSGTYVENKTTKHYICAFKNGAFVK